MTDPSKTRVILKSATRKTAIAKAVVTQGRGIIRINGRRVEAIENKYLRLLVMEPVLLIGDLSKRIDIRVKVRGGGPVSRIYAARCAIARAIVEYFDDLAPEIEALYKWYDRYLLVEDTRKKEMKKFGGPGARARFQTSYR